MKLDGITLRGEMAGDEALIDDVVCQAFRSMIEVHVVRLLRAHYTAFDRRYSVTAWDGDTLVGHILFTPCRIRLMGEDVEALAVAPVAVRPGWQRQGIGGKMLRYGHELGRREGFALAYLVGVSEYYPQFGYEACHGFATATIKTDVLPAAREQLVPRPVRNADVAWITACFAREWADVDFSWQWEDCLDAWALPRINSLMWWTRDGRRAGYTLQGPDKGWRMVLADDAALAREVIATIRPEVLSHHPAGWLAQQVLADEWAEVEVKVRSVAMAYELQEGVLGPYREAVAKGEREVGCCPWPLPYVF